MPDINALLATLESRDVRSDLTPNETQRTTLIVGSCYIIPIAILWLVPVLCKILYPFKLLITSMHEYSHAVAAMLTCAKIHSIELDPEKGKGTITSGGIQLVVLSAGYLGSSLIGACLIACGFDTNASKVAMIILAAIFVLSLTRARWDLLNAILILCMCGLILACWFAAEGVALRYLVLFIGVMSCMYVVWDTIEYALKQKDNESDAHKFAQTCGCCPWQVWGVVWLVIAFIFYAAGVLVGLALFKDSAEQQLRDSRTFIPTPNA